MLQPLDLSAEDQRNIILLVPFVFAFAAISINRPSKRLLTGAFLACIWNFVTLLPANWLAARAGWWEFEAAKRLLLGVPFDILLGWSVWWGAALFLALRGGFFIWAALVALWLDLLWMPGLSPLINLGENWLWGEAFVLIACFIPGWFIAYATARDSYVGWRAAGQAVMTGLLLVIFLPAVLLEQTGRNLWEVVQFSGWKLSLLLNALLLPIILGLAGNQEFAARGQGTPIPFDPPKKLVVTGPYAYVGNPMQISIFLMLLILAIACQSLALAGAAIVSVIYCLGVVRWHHTIDMEPRFGAAWEEYRQNVRSWLPRCKPWIKEPSTVYFARHCGICSDTENWLTRLQPVGLTIADISQYPGTIGRVTYKYPDGSDVSGIYAIASCLNHVNLAFAFLGWFMRLPGIRHFLQILIDGSGERATPLVK